MEWTRDRIFKKMQEIQSRVPENLRKNVVREVKSTPTIEMVMKEALKSESIAPEKKAQIQVLMDNGDFSKTRFVENKRIAVMIDNFVKREINKAVKAGQLPSKKQLAELIAKENEQVQSPGR